MFKNDPEFRKRPAFDSELISRFHTFGSAENGMEWKN